MPQSAVLGLERRIDKDFDKEFSGLFAKERFEDERIKLYFLGNNPKSTYTRKPRLHFLATPRDYNLRGHIGRTKLMYIDISPFDFSAIYSGDGAAEEISYKSKRYIILTDYSDDETIEYALPYQSEQEFLYKIVHKELWSELIDLEENKRLIGLGKRCEQEKTLDTRSFTDHLDRIVYFQDKLPAIYTMLMNIFKDHLDSTKPLILEETLREDNKKRIMKYKKKSSFQRYIDAFKRGLYGSFDESIIEPERLRKKDETTIAKEKEFLGSLYDPAKKALKKVYTQLNNESFYARFLFNFVMAVSGSITGSFILDEKHHEDIAKYIYGYAGLDTLVGLVNAGITYFNNDVVAAPGIIGTIRELIKRDNYYIRKLKGK